MFTIGDFSRVARVSCRLLRYYDELGLLRPAAIDASTGYRYYSAAQLPQLNRILVLKELGFSLEEIARFLDQSVAVAELRGMLLLRRAESARALTAEAERLRHIETRIAQIEAEGQLSSEDVIIREQRPIRFLYVRKIVQSFAAARVLLRQVAETVRRQTPADALGPLMAVAHSAEFEADHIDLQVGYELKRPLRSEVHVPDHGPMSRGELAGAARMATCVRVGLPEHAHLITARIARSIEANGYSLNGPSREVFLEPPHFDAMERSVVEMQYPLAIAE
jgi:DNA-binding transcriptional MerR regulator